MEPRISRREALMIGLGAAGLLAGCGDDGDPTARATSTPAARGRGCVLTPEQTEGPYYVSGSLLRADITEGRDGTPLQLRLTVQDASDCRPIERATVELWHCDAAGTYSGVQGDDGTFLRGAQRTGPDGAATFKTIYPGWYPGRAPHIHVKVHAGGQLVHTGQLYFDDAVSERVYAAAPYRGAPDTPNAADGIYPDGGDRSTLALRRRGPGYRGSIALGVTRAT